jgi:glycosyltransferase involved in cell wall biosynthesis
MIELSIIVPVYNVESYLERCIVSLLNQDIELSQYEILLVNDGSTDESLAVAQQLEKESDNVRIISQKNQGLSGARNTGIKNASGKYVWFVDADDYIEHNCLKQLLDEADNFNVDAYAFLEKKISDGSIEFELHCKQILPLGKVIDGKWATLHGFYPCSSCAYFFNREFLQKNGLFFILGITHQDVEFTTRAITVAKRIVFTDYAPYYYDFNPNSLSKSKSREKQRKYILDEVLVAYYIKSYAQKQTDIEIMSLLERRANSIICGLFLTFVREREKRVYRNDAYSLAQEKGLYPIRHPLLTWKLLVVSVFLNQKWLINKLFPLP